MVPRPRLVLAFTLSMRVALDGLMEPHLPEHKWQQSEVLRVRALPSLLLLLVPPLLHIAVTHGGVQSHLRLWWLLADLLLRLFDMGALQKLHNGRWRCHVALLFGLAFSLLLRTLPSQRFKLLDDLGAPAGCLPLFSRPHRQAGA